MEMNQDCFTEFLSKFFEMSNCEMDILMLWATKGTFKGIDIAMI